MKSVMLFPSHIDIGIKISIDKPNLFKKKTSPAIYALNSEDGVLIPFSDGIITGGKLFKSLYGVLNIGMIPRVKDALGNDWDELPYPVAEYGFKTIKD